MCLTILDCALPCIHVIAFTDCVGGIGLRRLESTTELLLVLAIYIIMEFIEFSWNSWNSFNVINLKSPSGYTLKKILSIFVETGHVLTDLVIDATEFKFRHASKFELNSLCFAKSTRKTLLNPFYNFTFKNC